MAKYVIKKLFQGVVTLLVVVVLVFTLFRLMPKENFFTEDEKNKFSPEQKEMILQEAGLLDPIPIQLKNYFIKLFHGDFGTSTRIERGKPVLKIIRVRVGVSFRLGVISLLVSLVLGVGLGTIQTIYKDRLGDNLGKAYTLLANAVPGIVTCTLIYIIGSEVFGLPTMYAPRAHPVSSMVLPVLCLSLTSVSGYALWTRRYMVDELNKDYITLAKLKGLSNSEVMVKHVLRNALVPLVQFIPSSFIFTISGSLLVERMFAIPGMGAVFTGAIQSYDIEVVQTLTLIYAALGILGVVLGDILMSIVDPRINLSKEGGTR